MSFLDRPKVRRFLALSDKTAPARVYVPPPSLEDRLGYAAAERGYAFDLIDRAHDALRAAASDVRLVSEEAALRAVTQRDEAYESAQRIRRGGDEAFTRNMALSDRADANFQSDDHVASIIRNLLPIEGNSNAG